MALFRRPLQDTLLVPPLQGTPQKITQGFGRDKSLYTHTANVIHYKKRIAKKKGLQRNLEQTGEENVWNSRIYRGRKGSTDYT